MRGQMSAEDRSASLAGGNRCETESRVDGEGLEGTHNGVRGDDVVVVKKDKEREQRNHQSDEGGCHHVRT